MAKSKGFNKKNILIVVLIVLLAVSFSYIGFTEYNKMSQQQQFSAYQAGLNDGASQAILEIMGRAAGCEVVQLYNANVTMDIVATDCLQLGQGG